MQDFKNLVVWQKAHQLTLNVYQLTRGFPSASIPTNIAEG